jgi:hypothetical protein
MRERDPLRGWNQFQTVSWRRHPEGPRFYQRAEGSRVHTHHAVRDPSLRLKNGSSRDDAAEELRPMKGNSR